MGPSDWDNEYKECLGGQMIRQRPKTTANSVNKVKDAQQEDITHRVLELQQQCKVILGKVQDERDQQIKRSEATARSLRSFSWPTMLQLTEVGFLPDNSDSFLVNTIQRLLRLLHGNTSMQCSPKYLRKEVANSF